MSIPEQCDPEVRATLARKHWPTGITGSREHEELVRRGWPYLRLLVDDDPRDGKPAALALEELDAVDPVPSRVVSWPREASRRYLHAFSSRKHVASRKRITVEVADRILTASFGRLERYPFHWQDALFLLEAWLGTETMLDRTITAIEKTKRWVTTNPHDRGLQTLFAAECFLLRADRDAAMRASTRLAAVLAKRPPASILSQRLAMMMTGGSTLSDGALHLLRGFLTIDRALVERYLAHEHASWRIDPQQLYVFGPNLLTDKIIAPMKRDPPWKQQERAEVFTILRHPQVDRMLA
jgi:hypothetical protein